LLVLGLLGVGWALGGVAQAVLEEAPVEVTFFKAPPPPPPPPSVAPVPQTTAAAPRPPPPARSKPSAAPTPASLPPARPVEVPSIAPSTPPPEADPSLEQGSPGADPSGAGEPFGQRGGEAGGKAGGRVDGQTDGAGTGPASSAPGPIVLPPGAESPVDLTPDIVCPYPEQARIARMEGVVQVKTVVEVTGRLRLVKIIRSNPIFDAAAEECVQRKRFKPAVYNGQSLAVYRNLTFNFRP
jgi:TonB family protein